MRILWLLSLASLVPMIARADKGPAKAEVEYVDDDAVLKNFTEKLGELAKKGKCLPPDKLKELMAEDKVAKVESAAPSD